MVTPPASNQGPGVSLLGSLLACCPHAPEHNTPKPGVVAQDCAVLSGILSETPDDLDAALERYERTRKPDAHALGTMDHQARCLSWHPTIPGAALLGHAAAG